MSNKQKREAYRDKVLSLADRGLTAGEIAEIYPITVETICKWMGEPRGGKEYEEYMKVFREKKRKRYEQKKLSSTKTHMPKPQPQPQPQPKPMQQFQPTAPHPQVRPQDVSMVPKNIMLAKPTVHPNRANNSGLINSLLAACFAASSALLDANSKNIGINHIYLKLSFNDIKVYYYDVATSQKHELTIPTGI